MAGSLKLLVVDDEEVVCESCRRIFCAQGFEVHKCSDPHRGLSLAQNEEFAVVLLDVRMPEMSGLELLSHLRESRPQLPAVFMTAYPNDQDAAMAHQLGAGYVTKPFTPEEIVQALQGSLIGKEEH